MTMTEQKIISAIKYFVAHTKNVGRTKLFKLLYFMDFIHFKKYGLSVTGYDYFTFPFGPVPRDLYEKIVTDTLGKEFKNEIEFNLIDDKEEETEKYKSFRILVRDKKNDLDIFSPNELKVLKEVAEIFKYATAKDMTNISHLPHDPWDTTKTEKGLNQPIDYFLSIDKDTPFDRETIEERFRLQKELLSDGRI